MRDFLTLAPSRRVCGLDFVSPNSADGPAVFVILIVGFIVAGAALSSRSSFSPPIWVHVVLWGPLVLILASAC